MSQVRFTFEDGFLENFLSRRRADIADKLIAPHLRQGKIVDIGCGRFPYFLSRVDFAQKYGIDSSVDPTERLDNITLLRSDAETLKELPFSETSIHAVTMLAAIEHFQPAQLPAILKEVRRVLVPGGCFIVTTPCPWSAPLLRGLARLGLVSRRGVEEHKAAYSPGDLKDLFMKAGFRREDMCFGYFEMFLNSWCRTYK